MLIKLKNNHYIDINQIDIQLWEGAVFIQTISPGKAIELIRESDAELIKDAELDISDEEFEALKDQIRANIERLNDLQKKYRMLTGTSFWG